MKRHGLRLLVLLNAGLLVALLLMWIRPDGSLRGVSWHPPAPRLADYAAQLPLLPSPAPSDTATFVAMLERPLFAGTRRPPPPPPPPPAAVVQAPPDNFSTAKLTGIVQSGGTGGVIIRIADKDKRVQLNQALEGWTLKSISGREVTFTKGGESRVMQLQRSSMLQAPAQAGTSPAALVRVPGAQPALSAFLPAPSGPPDNASPPVLLPSDAASDSLAQPSGTSTANSLDAAPPAAGALKAPRAVFGGTRAR